MGENFTGISFLPLTFSFSLFSVGGWGKLGPSIRPTIFPENHMDWTDGLMQFAISKINALLDECLHTMCGLLD